MHDQLPQKGGLREILSLFKSSSHLKQQYHNPGYAGPNIYIPFSRNQDEVNQINLHYKNFKLLVLLLIQIVFHIFQFSLTIYPKWWPKQICPIRGKKKKKLDLLRGDKPSLRPKLDTQPQNTLFIHLPILKFLCW